MVDRYSNWPIIEQGWTLKASTHKGACSCNTLPEWLKAPSSAPMISSEKICCATKLLLPGKYPNQYTRGSLLLKHAPPKQISVHTRGLAPETESCNRFAPGACSLVSNWAPSLPPSCVLVGVLTRERVSGACFRSKLLCVYWLEYLPWSVFQERVSGASSLVCTGL